MTNHHSTHQSANTAVRDAMNSVKPCDDDTAFARIQSQLPSARQITAMSKREKAPRRSVLRPALSIGLVLACTAAVVGVVGYNIQDETPTDTADVAGGGRQGVPVQLPGAQPLPQMEIGDRLPLQWAEPVSDGGRVVDIPDSAAQEVTVQGQTIRVKPLIYGDAKFVQISTKHMKSGTDEMTSHWVRWSPPTPEKLFYVATQTPPEWAHNTRSEETLTPEKSVIYRYPTTGKNAFGLGLGKNWWNRFDVSTPSGVEALRTASLESRDHKVRDNGLYDDCIELLSFYAHSAEERVATMRMLDTMPDVTVTPATFRGKKAVAFEYDNEKTWYKSRTFVDVATGHVLGMNFSKRGVDIVTIHNELHSLTALPPGLVSSWKSMEGQGFCSWRNWADGPIEVCTDTPAER